MSRTTLRVPTTQATSSRLAATIGIVGGFLGVVAGLVQLAVGPEIRAWVGNKQDTTRLGLATLLLSVLALTAAVHLRRHPVAPAPARFLTAVGLLIPAAVCFTTVGRLWYVPGTMLITAGLFVLVGLRGQGEDVVRWVERRWLTVLTLALAADYGFLGAVALGLAGVLGIAGAILIGAALVAARHGSAVVGVVLLLLGALPFAVLTWWSVISPVLGVLVIVIGSLAISKERRFAARRGVMCERLAA